MSCLSILLGAVLSLAAEPALVAGGVCRMPADLPELEPHASWQESLEDLAALGVPDSWLFVSVPAAQAKKGFEQRSNLPAESSDDWRALNPAAWTRPKDEEGCEVDLAAILGRKRDTLVFAQTTVEWPAAGPALLWFDTFSRALVYLNNAPLDFAHTHRRRRERLKPQLCPVWVQMQPGKNILKLKLAPHDDRKFGFSFSLRLERNDLAWRERLLKRLCELYPDEASGWRGAEAQLELARKYEAAGQSKEALALYQKVREAFPKDEDYASEAAAASQRLLRAEKEQAGDSTLAWGTVKARVAALLNKGEAAPADRLLRAFAARFPFNRNTGAAVSTRGVLRLDYGWGRECQPFFERALREFALDQDDARDILDALALARSYRPELAEVPVGHELQLQVDAVRRQLTGGNAADIESAVRTVESLMHTNGEAVLRAGDSPFTPRYAGLREYL
ncbi:MAG: hypothetical protein ABSE73_07225, partial [Planctomycetota bacterium]